MSNDLSTAGRVESATPIDIGGGGGTFLLRLLVLAEEGKVGESRVQEAFRGRVPCSTGVVLLLGSEVEGAAATGAGSHGSVTSLIGSVTIVLLLKL